MAALIGVQLRVEHGLFLSRQMKMLEGLKHTRGEWGVAEDIEAKDREVQQRKTLMNINKSDASAENIAEFVSEYF